MTDQNSQSDRNQQNDPQQRGQGGGGGGPQQQPRMPFNRNLFGWLMIIGLAVAVVVLISHFQHRPKQLDSFDELLNHAASGHVKQIVVKDDALIAVVKPDTPNAPASGRYSYQVSRDTKSMWVEKLYDAELGVPIREDPSSDLLIVFLQLLPWLLIFGVIWFFLFRAVRSSGGGMGMLGNFGRSRHKVVSKEMTNIHLEDVAGVEEAKEEVQEIIEFLKHPKKFQRLGGRVPRGVLLVGHPGCGKTLLAKAVAGEAEVPYFSISGSDFVEMFVGVGASRVRDLFKQAKDSSPCIIFLDEIDAVGRRRGAGFASGGHDEREQTLNAILVEMDGFDTNDQVIVIAATNRQDVLDPALTRPGRFDRQINVSLPDIKGRLEILKVHSKRVKMDPQVDLERVARQTPMFSGADLAAIINEAAIIATMRNKDFVDMDDLEEARDKVKFGKARRSRQVEKEERIGTAYHEAGHAFINLMLPDCDPLHKVTIIPRGQALGATFSLPEKDRYGYGRRFVDAELRRLCGGRVAEEKKTGDMTSGAAMDIRMATQYARHMVLQWGMSDRLGFVDYSTEENASSLLPEKGYSEETGAIIDAEIKRIIDEAYEDAEKLIGENWEKLVALAEALLKYETLSAEEAKQVIEGKPLHKPSVSELLESEAAKSTAASDADQAQQPQPSGPSDEQSGPDAVPSPA